MITCPLSTMGLTIPQWHLSFIGLSEWYDIDHIPYINIVADAVFCFRFQEPFASMHIAFHDGVFDHGSRLFSALHYSWYNSTEDSSDVNVRPYSHVPSLASAPFLICNIL